jgi:hypothetical protein
MEERLHTNDNTAGRIVHIVREHCTQTHSKTFHIDMQHEATTNIIRLHKNDTHNGN